MADRFRAGKRLWSAEDDAALRAAYPHEPTAVLAQRLRRSISGIYTRAGILGLHKSAAYLASPAACRLRRRGADHPGLRTQFPPGHVPANKGLRRPGYSVGRGRMQETQFKAGERQGVAARNWRPIGTIAIDPEGYRRIKVREARPGEAYGFGNVRVWPLLQRHLWVTAHGPIRRGRVIVFKDGNRAHCVLENLECLTRRQLMARNSVHNLPPSLKTAVQLLGALKRQITRRTDHAREEQDRRPA